jgi:Rod binding domain-containing protein
MESESFQEITALSSHTEKELESLAREQLTSQLKQLESKGRAEKIIAQFLDKKYIKKEKTTLFVDRIVENV